LAGIVVLVLCGQSVSWLRGARDGNGGNFSDDQVDDAADVILLSPYFGFIVMFSCVYSQMSSTFILQGCQMDLRIGSGKLFFVGLFFFVAIGSGGIKPNVVVLGADQFDPTEPEEKKQIGFGYVFALLSMIVAAVVELYRKDSALLDVKSNCGDVMMSSMSVWWQTPQYILVGIAEILINISAIDLFYSQAPESMRSVCQALNLLTQTAGGMVSAGLLSIMNSWFTDDLNKGHLEYIFLAFGILVVFNLFCFYHVSQGFVYKDDRKHDRVQKIADASIVDNNPTTELEEGEEDAEGLESNENEPLMGNHGNVR